MVRLFRKTRSPNPRIQSKGIKINPYQAPQSQSILRPQPADAGERTGLGPGPIDIRRVLLYKRGMVYCIRCQIGVMISHILLPVNLQMDGFVAVAVCAVGAVGAVFVYLFGVVVYARSHSLLLGALSIIPCVGSFVLLFANHKVTYFLRGQGIVIGLFQAHGATVGSR